MQHDPEYVADRAPDCLLSALRDSEGTVDEVAKKFPDTFADDLESAA